MYARKIRDGVDWVGAIDWERRLFDSLIPIPDGTSYNAYLIQGRDKTALVDSVDPAKANTLLEHLQGVAKVDYIIAHHAEQDHSGSIPLIAELYPEAKVIATPKGKSMLIDHLLLQDDRFLPVEDGQTLSLGDKTLQFIHTPWVHWPETMSTWLEEDKILFSCDFFGSHYATSDIFADKHEVYDGAKRYYAEIMMPFGAQVLKNVDKVTQYPIEIIGPSHGPVYDDPAFIIEAYRDWAGGEPQNIVCLPYVTMHDSTRLMVEHLTAATSSISVTSRSWPTAE